jgi:predicted N-acetyltransferase YhbS
MHIDYLADHMEFAPVLAAGHHAEWSAHYADWPLAQALAELQSHTSRRQIPTTLVAIEDDRLLGSVSLLGADLDGWDHLTPWLASLFVIPERRGQSLGRQLVARAVEEAASLGVPTLYLWTAGQRTYYERLQWEPIATVPHMPVEIAIMRRVLTC